MSKRALPAAPEGRPAACKARVPESAQAKWQGTPQAAVMHGRNIDIFGEIGEDMYGEGTASAQISQMLRDMGPGDVTVNIDSPGGDMFAGLAIYNQLRSHDGVITVNVVGTAASAASVIAMAGDTVNMQPAAFIMIHQTWLLAAGNSRDFIALAEMLAPFDKAMADIYAARTGKPVAEVQTAMSEEKWFNADEAVAFGLADKVVTPDQSKRKSLAAHSNKPEIPEFNAASLNALALQLQLLNLIKV